MATTPEENDGLKSTTDAALFLGINSSRVRVLAREGRLPGIDLGTFWVFRQDELEKFAKIDRPVGRPPAE